MRLFYLRYGITIFYLSVIQSQVFNVKPYLQNIDSTSVNILWECNSGDQSIVKWGETLDLESEIEANVNHHINNFHIHHAHLTQLDPGTKYYYKIIIGSLESDTSSFVTPNSHVAESPITLIAMSDMQKDWSNSNKFQEIVNQGIINYFDTDDDLELSDKIDFIMIPGDLVDNGLNHSEWSEHFFGPSEPLLSYVPLYPVLGNHENNTSFYFSYFHLPENGSNGYEEHWWWTDFSNVRVIGLDSNWDYQLQVQLSWLQNLLDETCDNTTIDFIFAQLHHPHKSELWTPGETSFSSDIVEMLEQFTTDCGKPSIHFFGHTHGYSRGHSIDHKHTMVNVATAGGAIDYWGEYPQADYPEFFKTQDEWGFVIADVEAGSDPKFTLKRISRGDDYDLVDNMTTDEFTIRLNNNSPDEPNPVYPIDMEVVADSIWLWANHFSDPDNDLHGFSQWQISTDCENFEFPVIDKYESYENWYYDINTQEGNSLINELVTGLDGEMEYCWRVRYRDRGLEWSEWSQPVNFTTGISLTSPNLLINPGAEENISGWVIEEGIFESLEALECNGFTPHSGEYYFCVGGLCEESSYAEVFQAIDVQGYTDCIDSNGMSVNFGGYLSNWSGWDQPEMYLQFLDENGIVLGDTETITTFNSSWTGFDIQVSMPPYTRNVKFILMGTRNGGQDNDSYFDDLFLKVIKDQTCVDVVSTDIDRIMYPVQFTLHQNFPNPFNPITTIKYNVPQEGLVNIIIYDMLGNVVNNLIKKNEKQGVKTVQWNATNNQGESVSAGVYLYSIKAGNFRQTKKMILLK